jgi:hypothetical protein
MTTKPIFAVQFYQLALHAYPAAFRRRHGAEMAQIFDDEWLVARHTGPGAALAYAAHIFSDLARTASHERLAALTFDDWMACGTATFCGATAAWIDFRASEVQATLLVLIVGAAYFSFFAEQRTWRWPLAVAAWLPAAHVGAFALGLERGPHTSLAHSPIVLPALAVFGVAATAALAGTGLGRALRRAFPLCRVVGAHSDVPPPA